MPAKTEVTIRVLILGSGKDAEHARQLAEDHAEVAIAARFTTTVTHMVVDETVKPSEPRLKKATDQGVPVMRLAAFKDLLGEADDTEVEAGPVVEDAPQAEEAAQEASSEAAAAEGDESKAAEGDTESAAIPEQAEAPSMEQDAEVESKTEADAVEAESKAESKPETAAEPEAAAESEAAEKVAVKEEAKPEVASEPAPEKEADVKAAASDKAVDESKPHEEASAETNGVDQPKAGFFAKVKALFGIGKK
ncbi:hypothetical protein [Natronoglycomyces albus]|uniref:Uncharacterized protein n=1 Tax=Natronoglycomyces albus TaxID=2811108 RepID=A0A895XN49_9ACTN|nr:hypothetical protein [Natronoglycomyces albus]QSB05202.1 hypothetical protein JQS30_15820 [Natronoglycomyces albus]